MDIKTKGSSNQDFYWTTFRLDWVIPALVISFLVVIVLFAISPLMQNLLELDPESWEAGSNGPIHSLNLDQVLDDVTFTLQGASADENQIAIAYAIHSKSGEHYELSDLSLTNGAGNEFPLTMVLGEVDTSDVSDLDLLPGEEARMFTFDASSITNAPKTLDLKLKLWLKSQATAEVVGPIAFSFEVPFTPGRIAETKQSHIAGGIALTLEKVVLTSSDLSAVICFEKPDSSYEMWLPISHIDVNNGENQARATLGSQSNPDEAGCTTNHYFPSLYDYNGTWSLTVTELVGINRGYTELGEPRLDQVRIDGHWVFEFELP